MGLLEDLQSMSEPLKTKVLVGATVVVMVIVIAIWLAYFNSLIAGFSGEAGNAAGSVAAPAAANQTVTATPASASAQGQGPSIWQNMYGGFMGFVRGLANIFQAPRQYLIKPSG